ncbi:hypothetical protein ACFY3V_31790 [Streptosporangium sp. NPDC000095]|uniref:hypothetical protein n=1 Tax=Streptosporangium sp. NPDC000095 TaxID=3366184 RepID=UPI0036B64D96
MLTALVQLAVGLRRPRRRPYTVVAGLSGLLLTGLTADALYGVITENETVLGVGVPSALLSELVALNVEDVPLSAREGKVLVRAGKGEDSPESPPLLSHRRCAPIAGFPPFRQWVADQRCRDWRI